MPGSPLPGVPEEVHGSTRPTTVRWAQHRPRAAAARTQARGRHVRARARRRGRPDRPARRPGHDVHPHEVPGRRPGAARGARPRPRGRDHRRLTSAPRSSSVSTTSRPPWRRPPSATRRSWPCSSEDAVVTDDARSLKRDMLRKAGIETEAEEAPEPVEEPTAAPTKPAVVPQSVVSRQMANPFLAPDFSAARPAAPRPTPLSGWELLDPLLRSFERAGDGSSVCMPLPEPGSPQGARRPRAHAAPGPAGRRGRGGSPHLPARRRARAGQDGRGAARRRGGEGLSHCSSSCRTSSRRTGCARPACGRPAARPPRSRATATPSTASPTSWWSTTRCSTGTSGGCGEFGFRGMVVDEAHFIKNKTSQRSQHVLGALRAHPGVHRAPAADGPHRHAADQRHRGLPRHLGVPRLDRREEAARRPDGRPDRHRPDARRSRVLRLGARERRGPRHRPSPQGRRRGRHPAAPHRRPARRAGRADRPVDPRRRARPRRSHGEALHRRPRGAPGPRRPRRSTTTSCAASPRGSRRTRPARRPATTSSA